MIGKAIHKILKDKISDLATGGIYPVVMPQNCSYPSVVYHNFTEYETSKDSAPNIIYDRLNLQLIGKTYKEVDDIGKKIRDVLDHYIDKSSAGLLNVPGYTDKGNSNSFIGNIDIQHIFYQDEEDDYFEKLELYTRRLEYDVYYYYDIMRFNYDIKNSDGYTPANPLALAYDFTQSKLMRDDLSPFPGGIDYDKEIKDGYDVCYVFNKLGIVKNLGYNPITSTAFNDTWNQYLVASSYADGLKQPNYEDGISEGTKPFLRFQNKETIAVNSSTATFTDLFLLPYGGMIILVYKPIGTGSENYILGCGTGSTDNDPLIFSHKKVGSDITIHFNPNGSDFTGSARERVLKTSTNSTNYWDAEYHFFCLSLGGSKNYTGGSYNQAGWYEYFNSNYNPKLTTGQIIKNNTIAGNTDTMPNDMATNFSVSRIGHTVNDSAGFRMYEMLLFIPNEAQTHNISTDAAPFQPTDIIYKKAKDYIYNKYKLLK